MTAGVAPHPASFRDPGSGVLTSGDSFIRFFRGDAIRDFEQAEANGLLQRLVTSGRLLPFERVVPTPDVEALAGPGSLTVRQQALPFVSYPYEWPFSMLRAAALLQLDVLVEALRTGLSLKDGSAVNVQFLGANPVFIDLGSFLRHQGGPWAGYAQFCRTCLNPLLLTSMMGVPFGPWLRGSPGGIEAADLSRLLPVWRKLRPPVLTHVWLQAALQNRIGAVKPSSIKGRALTAKMLVKTATSLAGSITGLKPPKRPTGWLEYRNPVSYSASARADKLTFVERVLTAAQPKCVWDVGSNNGEFAILAARQGAYVVATDSAPDVVDALARRVEGEIGRRILPLIVDAADPSPAQGWAGGEWAAFADRGRFDLVLMLALVHHLRFGANVPLSRIVPWMAASAPRGIVEFVPKADPMVQQLLRWRADVFDDYDRTTFERLLRSHASIVEVHEVADSARTLYVFGPK